MPAMPASSLKPPEPCRRRCGAFGSRMRTSRSCRCCAATTMTSPNKPPPHRTESARSEEHTSELQSRGHLVCRLLLEKKNKHANRLRPKHKPTPAPQKYAVEDRTT